jgi:hypothetical protein
MQRHADKRFLGLVPERASPKEPDIGGQPRVDLQPDRSQSRLTTRRLKGFHTIWLWSQRPPDQAKNLGTSTEIDKTSASRRTRRSPMLTHETSPVSGASVVWMTYGACHVPSYLLAGIPGVSTAQRYEDRLSLEGRLCQQPADVSTVEGQNRAMKTKSHQRLFHRKWAGPDKSRRGKGWK